MKKYPFISVLMPVRNEGAFMERSLKAVLAQDYPSARMEILVIDGRSTDDTRQTIASFQSSDQRIKLLDNPGRIVPTGLNAALRVAHGDIIVRVDGHCEIAPNYVSSCVNHLLAGEADAVGGPLETVGQSEIAVAIALAMSSPFGVGGSAFRTMKGQSLLTDTVAFPAYKRNVIERTGFFDEELVRNQDDEYNYRLRKLGGKILLAADVHCRYYSRSSLRLLVKQYYQYGYWKVRVFQKHPAQMKARHFVPVVFVASLLTLLLGSLFFGPARWVLGLELALYAGANLLASISTVKNGNGRLLPLLPIIYAALHVSYGTGFLVGLLKFSNRWLSKAPQPPPVILGSVSVNRSEAH